MAFDKKKYDNEYRKKKKKQFNVDLNIEEYESLNELLKKHGISKVKFVRDAYSRLKNDSEV